MKTATTGCSLRPVSSTNEHGKDGRKREPSRPVSDVPVDGVPFEHVNIVSKVLASQEAGLGDDAAKGIDDGADAAVGGPNHVTAVLDCAIL